MTELIEYEQEEHEGPDRAEFIDDLVALKLKLKKKRKKRAATKEDVEKGLGFCESNGYIAFDASSNAIQSTDRTQVELPFIRLIALGGKLPGTKREKTKTVSKTAKRKRVTKKPAKRVPARKTR